MVLINIFVARKAGMGELAGDIVHHEETNLGVPGGPIHGCVSPPPDPQNLQGKSSQRSRGRINESLAVGPRHHGRYRLVVVSPHLVDRKAIPAGEDTTSGMIQKRKVLREGLRVLITATQ